jgi:ankyrin repeat protein
LEDSLGKTALLFAAWRGNSELIQLLLSNGATLGASRKKETVFHTLAELGELAEGYYII